MASLLAHAHTREKVCRPVSWQHMRSLSHYCTHLLAHYEYLYITSLSQDRVRVSLIDQTKTQPNSPTHPPLPTTPRSSPKFVRRQSNLPPLSPPSPISLPPTAAPLRQPRRLADDQRPPPLRQGSALVVIETQAMAVQGFLRRVRGGEMSLGGVVVSKMELFCTQSKVIGVVHLDSLVFSVCLCSGNLSDGHIAC